MSFPCGWPEGAIGVLAAPVYYEASRLDKATSRLHPGTPAQQSIAGVVECTRRRMVFALPAPDRL